MNFDIPHDIYINLVAPFGTALLMFYLISPTIVDILQFPVFHPHQPILFQLFLSGIMAIVTRTVFQRDWNKRHIPIPKERIAIMKISELTSKQNNCDHFGKLIYYDAEMKPRCSGCDGLMEGNRLFTTVLKEKQSLESEIEEDEKKK